MTKPVTPPSYPPERLDDVYQVVKRVEEKLDTKVRHLDERNDARHVEVELRVGKLEHVVEKLVEKLDSFGDRMISIWEQTAAKARTDADQTSKIADVRTTVKLMEADIERRIRESVDVEMTRRARAWGIGGAGAATAASAIAAYLPDILRALFGH